MPGARDRTAHGDLPKPPTTYLRANVYFDTVVFTPHQLEALVKTYGADRIVMGTDYPFDMAGIRSDRPRRFGRASMHRSRAALCGGNAKKILGLK